jgi:hypothetical protein
MKVRVEMHGVLGRCDRSRKTRFDLALHDGVTAGDLLRILTRQRGSPFCDALKVSDARLPRHIRMFSDGQMLSTLEQPLVSTDSQNPRVNIVVLSPMMGG